MFLIYAFLGALAGFISTLLGKALFALGMGYLVFKGFDSTLSVLVDGMIGKVGSLPSDIRCAASALKFGVFVNIISSAISIRLMLMGLQSDTIKKIVHATSS